MELGKELLQEFNPIKDQPSISNPTTSIENVTNNISIKSKNTTTIFVECDEKSRLKSEKRNNFI
jgi:hypothetical protein